MIFSVEGHLHAKRARARASQTFESSYCVCTMGLQNYNKYGNEAIGNYVV